MIETSKEELLKICRNAEELIDEAKILLQHRKVKRAFLLALTSFEEAEKVKLLLTNNSEFRISSSHNTKLRSLDEGLQHMFNAVAQLIEDETILKVIVDSEDFKKLPFDSNETTLVAKNALKKIQQELTQSAKETKMMYYRNASLYYDPKLKLKIESASQYSAVEAMTVGLINSNESRIKELLVIVNRL